MEAKEMPAIVPHRLTLPTACADRIRSEAAAAFPEECCGLLIGHGQDEVVVERICPAANVSTSPEDHFTIDPQVQFDALRGTRGGPSRIVGHYHSHPNGAPIPSRHDAAMADDPQAVWVIVPVESGTPGKLRAFAFVAPDGAFSELSVNEPREEG